MELHRLTRHKQLVAVAAVLAVTSLFMPWFGEGASAASAFDSGFLAWAGVLLALAGAIVLMLKELDVHSTELGPVDTENLALFLASLGTLFIMLRLVTGGPSGGEVRFGLFGGMLTSAAIAYGCFCSRNS